MGWLSAIGIGFLISARRGGDDSGGKSSLCQTGQFGYTLCAARLVEIRGIGLQRTSKDSSFVASHHE